MPTSDYLISALVIMLGINLMLAAGQHASDMIGLGDEQFYNPTNSMICSSYDNGDCSSFNSSVNDVNNKDRLPNFGGTVSPTGSNSFFDTPALMGGNIKDSSKQGQLSSLVTAPYQFLQTIGLDDYLVSLIGSMWYLIMLTLLFFVIFGR